MGGRIARGVCASVAPSASCPMMSTAVGGPGAVVRAGVAALVAVAALAFPACATGAPATGADAAG